MFRYLVAFIILLVLTPSVFGFEGTKKQEVPTFEQLKEILLGPPALTTPQGQARPKPELTLADAVDALADYSLIYDPSPIFCAQYWGLTNFTVKEIRICGTIDLSQRRAVVIHELLHVVSFRRSVIQSEQYTEEEIQEAVGRIFKQLYGGGFKQNE